MHASQHPPANGAGAGTVAHNPRASALAQRQLRRCPYRPLHYVSCEFRAGVLTLRGHLPTYYLKQVALAAVATVDGIQHIDDQIEVVHGTREVSHAQ